MFLAMAKDIRVIIIKLADRLHNMRTLSSLPAAEAASDRARDDRDLRADRAPARIWRVKWDLEDLALRYLDPDAYRDIAERVAKKRDEREEAVAHVDRRAQERVREGRHRGRHHRPPEALLLDPQEDAQGPRLLDDLRPDRGARHRRHGQGLLRRARRGARDVEAAARAVQRLHRDAQAEHVPVAAHDGRRPGRRPARGADPHLGDAPHQRVRHRGALALQRRRQERRLRAEAHLAALAARVAERHARLAHVHGEPQARPVRHRRSSSSRPRATCSRCRRRRRRSISPTRCTPTSATTASARRSTARSSRSTTSSRTATSRDPHQQVARGPSLDWLSIVKTSGAKHKIKQWFRKERKEENTLRGQEAVEQELARAGLRADLARGDAIEKVAHEAELPHRRPTCSRRSASAMRRRAASCSACARSSRATTSSTSPRSRGRPATRRVARNASGIRIAGVDDVLVRLSKCCSPVPGDPIMGYVTIGKGVARAPRRLSEHRLHERARPSGSSKRSGSTRSALTHAVDIEIEAADRAGLLQDVIGVAAELKTQISSVDRARQARQERAISLTAQISDLDHLARSCCASCTRSKTCATSGA